MEVWRDGEHKYEVELVERTPVIKDGKTVEWILKYKVISEEKLTH
jgi:hypothetical protein